MFDPTFIAGHINYWLFIVLMMTGLYVVVAKGNLVKKIVGLNIFQVSVFMLYISIAKVSGGTAPIFPINLQGKIKYDPEIIYSNPLPHVLILTAIVEGQHGDRVKGARSGRLRRALLVRAQGTPPRLDNLVHKQKRRGANHAAHQAVHNPIPPIPGAPILAPGERGRPLPFRRGAIQSIFLNGLFQAYGDIAQISKAPTRLFLQTTSQQGNHLVRRLRRNKSEIRVGP